MNSRTVVLKMPPSMDFGNGEPSTPDTSLVSGEALKTEADPTGELVPVQGWRRCGMQPEKHP